MFDSAIFTNDATIFGILMAFLGLVFYTHNLNNSFWRKFYTIFPTVLVCYFLPSLLNTFGIIDASQSNIYYVASRYLLPAAIVLLTLSIDIKAIIALGPKLLIMFLIGTLGIVIGGPIALMIMGTISPDMLSTTGPDAVWRGMTTVAGSWIGGGANQAAMKEIYQAGDNIFSAMIAVDVIVGNIWLAVLLFLASRSKAFDNFTGADTSAVEELKVKAEAIEKANNKPTSLDNLVGMLSITFATVAVSHIAADFLTPWFIEHVPNGAQFSLHSKFFWMIITATTIGMSLSFTRARQHEAYGASKIGRLFIFILVASIGMKMNVLAIADSPIYFFLGAIWLSVHAILLLVSAKLLKAPLFYMAVGSQANVGGAASAPVVASAFHPALAPVGVLLAVLGYAVGTYAAWFCGQVLQIIAQ
ncbi:DUF819 family protein [Catenovulum sp. SM1970]|uniref:DUF819 family protein n=1 Tax=Marinifaba aquimaris TaxID=2741323 RepID=UPI0015729709|nr:DUF819 family protein [Marinifaba aquimaris]